MQLPQPKTHGIVSLEQVIKQRRTVRRYKPKALELAQLSQLVWSAQGVTDSGGFKRAAPSAGALYPMDLYAVVGQDGVNTLQAGVYHYETGAHRVLQMSAQDVRDRVARACLAQMWMARAPLNLVITAEYRRITGKYRQRGIRYAMIEAGHIGQNLMLQAEALGLKAGIVGAFHDKDLIRILKLPQSHEPLLILPIGYGA